MCTSGTSTGPTTEEPASQISHHNKASDAVLISVGDSIQPATRSNHVIVRLQTFVSDHVQRHRRNLKRFFLFSLLVAYCVYFGFALRHSVKKAVPLIVITALVVVWAIYRAVADRWGTQIYEAAISPIGTKLQSQYNTWLKWILYPCLAIAIGIFLLTVVLENVVQLQSVSGLVCFTFILWFTSKHLEQIRWRPVFWGFGLQFALGYVVLRWRPGYRAIKFLSDQITTILSYSNEGAAAAFTDPFFFLHPFAFYVIPMLIYIGTLLSILYYFGITQLVSQKIGWLMKITTGTTAVESTSVAANIFLNMLDTLLMLRNYIDKLTESEFHTFLVGSHSTVAGFAFGILILFGVPAHHLLSASFMSAPAAIAVSKLNFPETEESLFQDEDACTTEKPDEKCVYEAANNGAKMAAKSAATLLVQILSFLTIFKFINATLGWLGARINIKLSVEIIFSYIFQPFAVMMGISLDEAQKVSTLLGLKIFTNEILAFMDLGQLIRDDKITPRSGAISTYALCGFSSVGTFFIFVGVWTAVHPSKVRAVVRLLPRVLMNANLACFLTACIAGLMHTDQLEREILAENANSKTSELGKLVQIGNAIIPSYEELIGND